MLIKSALRDLLSVSYGMISILRIGSLRSPPPIRLCRTSPCSGGRINRSMLSCRDMAPWLSLHSPTTKWGEGGGASHQRGIAFPRPSGRLYGFRRQRRHKKMAPERAPTSPAQRYSDTIYLPRAKALNPSGRRQPIPDRTLGAQGQRPGGAINPHARKGVSTFGNTGKQRPGPEKRL